MHGYDGVFLDIPVVILWAGPCPCLAQDAISQGISRTTGERLTNQPAQTKPSNKCLVDQC